MWTSFLSHTTTYSSHTLKSIMSILYSPGCIMCTLSYYSSNKYWLLTQYFSLLPVGRLQHSVVHCGLHMSLKTGWSSGWHQVWWKQSKPLCVFSFPSMSLTCFFSHDVNRLLCSTAVFRFCCTSSCMVCVAMLADCVWWCFCFFLSVVFERRLCTSCISAGESERWMGAMERVVTLHQDMWRRSAELAQRLYQSHVRESPSYML